MKLTINNIPPPPPPPATYDLIGLDQREMAIIAALIGANCGAVTDEILKAAGLPTGGDVNKGLYDQLAEYRKLTKGNLASYEVKIMTKQNYEELLYRGM